MVHRTQRKGSHKRRKPIWEYKVPSLITIMGYRVLLIPMKREVVMVQSYVNAGFISETKATSGIAHLLEHVLMDSWSKCKNGPCENYWNHQGVTSNASTDLSMLNYWIEGLKEDMDEMLEYIISITCNPTLTDADIRREKKIVKNELLISYNEPITRLHNACSQKLYASPGLRYSQNMKQQLRNLSTFTRKDLDLFRKRYYTPANIFFAVSGGFKRHEVTEIFQRRLSTHGCPISLLPPPCFSPGSHIIFDRNKEGKNTDIVIIFHTGPFQDTKKQMYFPILNDIIGGSMSSALVRLLRLKLKLIYSLSFDISILFCGLVVTFSMSTEDDNVRKTIIKTMQTIRKLTHTLIDKKLLRNAKRKYMRRFHTGCYTPASIGDFYTLQYMNQMYDTDPILYTPNAVKHAVHDVTAGTIRSLLMDLFSFRNCIIGYQGRKEVKLSFSDF